jgi:ankyrin repeat protein
VPRHAASHLLQFCYILRSLLRSNQEIEHYVQNNSDPNQRDKHGNTPLIVCCQVGNKRAVKLLIKAGADLNACNVRRLQICGHLFFI